MVYDILLEVIFSILLISEKSIHRKVSSVKAYAKFLFVKEFVDEAITIEVHLPKIKSRIPTYVKENDMNKLLDELELKAMDFDSILAYTVVSMFYHTGIRRSELIEVLDSNISLSSSEIKVMGKGGKERIIPMGKELVRVVDKFLRIKNETASCLAEQTLIDTNDEQQNH